MNALGIGLYRHRKRLRGSKTRAIGNIVVEKSKSKKMGLPRPCLTATTWVCTKVPSHPGTGPPARLAYHDLEKQRNVKIPYVRTTTTLHTAQYVYSH